MTEFMNDGALLRRHQQQQQARRLEHLPHTIWHQPLSPIGFGEAIRIWVNLQ
jgi:predicted component of type VI protein secretion system